MIRLAVIAALSISVFVMMQGISAVLQQQTATEAVRSVAKESVVLKEVAEKYNVQPDIPVVLPDFNAGYLFNADRMMEEEGALPPEDELAGNDLGLSAKVQDVTFSGALIGDTIKLALISFPAVQQKLKRSRSSKSKRSRKSTSVERARVKEGDVLSGYKVVAIYPDKIIFEKGAEIIEKFLYDPAKKRVTPARNTKARGSARSAAARRPPAGVPPLPPGAVSARRPKARESKRAIPRSATKRLVVSRKPAPRPDTSRVSRRRRSTSIAPPVSSPSGTPFGAPHP